MASSTNVTNFKVDLVEKELITVELSRIDLIPRKSYIGDIEDVTIISPTDDNILVYEDGYWVNKNINVIIDSYAVQNETPIAVIALPSKKFKTINTYRSESLEIYLNGQKVHTDEITQLSDTQFEFPINILAGDKVECSYIRKE